MDPSLELECERRRLTHALPDRSGACIRHGGLWRCFVWRLGRAR